MKSSRWLFVLNALLLVSLSSCLFANSASSQLINRPIKKTETIAQNQSMSPKLVQANTRFGFKLYSEILKQNNGKNVFVSPSSVAIALAMTYNGASGETKTAMAKTLELQGLNLDEINQGHEDLKALLGQADPNVQVSIANSIWARQDISFDPNFIQRNQKFYDAKVTALDFAASATVQTMNNWVKENTRGKIDKIVDRINPDQVMFLMNAVYFKGKWTNEFDKNQTQERPFYLGDRTQKQQPFMKQQGKYSYYETDKFQAISLPYGNERMSLYVFLPKSNSNLSQFEQTLTAENWQTWMDQFSKRSGSIQLPRFKMSYDTDLKDALSALGMRVAFNPSQANFSNLSRDRLSISDVKHKTFVEVNEEGTEAAATTSVGIALTSAPMPTEPFNMIVDRPFFCAIRDNQSGEILFMGSIQNPQ